VRLGRVEGVLRRLLMAVVLCGCNSESRPDHVIVVGRPDTLIPAEKPWLEEGVDLAVSGAGVVHVLDRQANRVFRLDEKGQPMSPLGRGGSGPGEFRSPRAMGVGEEEIWVLDRGNGRMVGLSSTGAVVGSEPLAAQPLIPTSHVDKEGNQLIATLGRHSTLVRGYGRDGILLGEYGTPIGEPLLMFDPGATLAAIRQGEVPSVMRNQVTPVSDGEGHVWLFLETEGILFRYDFEGTLEAEYPLQCPEFEAARSQFFLRNLEDPPEFGVVPLRYSADIDLVGDEVWILLHQESGQPVRILAVNQETGATRRLTVEGIKGATQVAIDEDREWLFALLATEAELLRVSLAGTGALGPAGG